MVSTLIFSSLEKVLISASLSRSTAPFNDNRVMKREKKIIKDNSSVLQIFKLFIQPKGDFATDGRRQVVDAAISSRGNSVLPNTHWSCAWKTQERVQQFPLSCSNLMRQSWLSKSKWEGESKHFSPNNKMYKIGFFFFIWGFLSCFLLKKNRENPTQRKMEELFTLWS